MTETAVPTLPDIAIVTAHGRRRLTGAPNERLIDVLSRGGVPWSATAIYGTRRGGDTELLPALGRRLDELRDFDEVLVYFNRNVNPFLFALGDFAATVAGSDGGAGSRAASEYVYQMIDNDQATVSNHLVALTPQACRDIVADRIGDVVRDRLPGGGDLVVGVSGGGDSNAMLDGLSKAAGDGLTIHPVIVKGIPDWDAGVPRAEALCAEYGLSLTVLEEREVRAMMGIPVDGVSLVERFEREFAGDDFEFLGTLIIRIALAAHAKRIGTSFIATGLNLEDVACEQLYRLTSGLKPTSMPERTIGETTLLMPLWMCPKRIIDGCFPKYALDNYEARYPCFSMGRNLYYSMAYTLQSTHPGSLEALVRGLSTIAERDPVVYADDPGLGVPIERFVPFPLRQRFERMLGGRIDA